MNMSSELPINWSTQPLILNKNLCRKTFTDYLGSGFKIRESTSTPKDSIILPQCGTAILVVYLDKVNGPSSQSSSGKDFEVETLAEMVERLDRFRRQHRGALFLLISPAFGDAEFGIIVNHITKEFLPSPPPTLLAHSDAQAASHVQTIAKAMRSDVQQIVEKRKEMLINSATQLDVFKSFSSTLGLSLQDSTLLKRIYGDIQTLSKASIAHMRANTNLTKEKIIAIQTFFHE